MTREAPSPRPARARVPRAGVPRDALLQVLEQRRPWINERVTAARREGARVDLQHLARHLTTVVKPVVDAVAATVPDRVDATAAALVDVSLDLASHHWFGPRESLIADAWRTVLASGPRVLAAAPESVARAVSQAVANLGMLQGTRPHEWMATMAAAGPLCESAEEWLACGRVAAWMAGLAHGRRAAFEAAASLRPAVLQVAFGFADDVPPPPVEALIAALTADPWLQPARAVEPPHHRSLRNVATVGGFRGFGGPFLSPPDVVRVEDRFVLFDTDSAWVLTVDVRGATFVRVAASAVDTSAAGETTPFDLGPGGLVSRFDQQRTFPELTDVSSAAANQTTLVVTVPRSHDVFVVAFAEDP